MTAYDTYLKWRTVCETTTGTGNSYQIDGIRYILRQTKQTGEDITGTVLKVLETNQETGISQAIKVGSYRINEDGDVARYPTGLRKLLDNKTGK